MKKTAVVVTSLALASSVALAQSVSISPSGTAKIAPDNASGSKGQETAPGQMKKEYGGAATDYAPGQQRKDGGTSFSFGSGDAKPHQKSKGTSKKGDGKSK
jgi:hypothetical protein